jgi:hypothetical protein
MSATGTALLSCFLFVCLNASAATNSSAGTLVASFNCGSVDETITGESGPSGDHNQDGLVISGMPAEQQWVNVTSSSTNSGSGSDNSSGSAITFSFNLSNADTDNETPSGFVSGDLRDRTWRLLAPSHGTTGATSGYNWSTHPGYCEWELSGLTPSAYYDLIFYGGAPSRPCSISIAGYTATNDAEGDENFTGVKADGSGKIVGTWNQPTGDGEISNFGGVQIAEAPSPDPGVFLSADTVPSNAPPGTLIGNLSMNNTNGTFSYTLEATGDYTYFDIASSSTNLRTAKWIDSASYSISIKGSNSVDGFTVTNDFTVRVDAVDPHIAFTVSATMDATPNGSEVVGILSAAEWPAAGGIGFDIVGGREELFTISGNTNIMQIAGSDPGPSGSTNYLTIRATNSVATSYLQIACTVGSSASATVFRFR